MKIINNMKIRNKLLIMIIFPVLAMLYFSITGLINKVCVLREMNSMQALSSFSTYISEVIHELQKERGRTGPFLLSKGALFSNELHSQMLMVDKKLEDLNNYIEEQGNKDVKKKMKNAYMKLSSLNGKREQINALQAEPDEIMNFYTGVIESLFDVITSLAAASSDSEISNRLFAYQAFMQKKEHVGLERAILCRAFYLNSLGEESKKVYYFTLRSQDIFKHLFQAYATEEQKQFFSNLMLDDSVSEIARIRKIVEDRMNKGDFGIDYSHWFRIATRLIDNLKDVENKIASDLNKKAQELWINARMDLIMYAIIIFVSLLLTFLLSYSITRKIVFQIKKLVDTMKVLARGDLSKRVAIVSKDEVGQLGVVFNDMGQKIQDNAERERREAHELKQKVDILRTGVEKIATGDLTYRFDSSDDSALSQLNEHLNSMVESLAAMSRQISEASNSMNATISEVQSAINMQSSGASQQAASINETTSTLEEIKATSTQTREKAEALGKASERTRQEGERGIDAVSETITAMQSIREKVETIAKNILALSEQTQQIGEITTTVNNLAQQLKMLSLNASIEANKAGEAGRGFAVVATEVKDLAVQSQQATAQVHKILQDIQSATEKAVMVTEEGTKGVDFGVQLVEQTGEIVKNLSEVIEETSLASQQIVAAVRQEAVGIDQISVAMSDINKAVSQFVVSTKQTMEAADNLSEISSQLSKRTSVYKY